MSQALSILVASFLATLESVSSPAQENESPEFEQIRLLERCGFLLMVESLLSTYGNESGMLEDLEAAVTALNEVTLMCIESVDEDKPSCCIKIECEEPEASAESSSTSERLVVTLLLRPASFAVIDRSKLHAKAKQRAADSEMQREELLVVRSASCSKDEQVSAYIDGFASLVPQAELETEYEEDSHPSHGLADAVTGSAELDLPPDSFVSLFHSLAGLEPEPEVSQSGPAPQPEAEAPAAERQASWVDRPCSRPCRCLYPCSTSVEMSGATGRAVAVPITAVLFTQGVNEQQTLAHKIEKKLTRLQDDINVASLQRLLKFHRRYLAISHTAAASGRTFAYCDPKWPAIESILEELGQRVYHADGLNSKQAEILSAASTLARRMGGARATHCKSGKDRTAMSVTLEQTAVVEEALAAGGAGLRQPGSTAQQVRDVMRSHGVRRENLRLNIGNDRYAFNEYQVPFLPEVYRPPQGTYGSNQT
jgi:hypothetical protein